MKEFVLQGPGGDRKLHIDYDAELNPEQLDVVKHGDGPSLVLAGAGSGKTRTITYRVAWLLEHGVQPHNILLLTFTNRAAREMIERVESLIGMYPQGLWSGTFHSIANRILRTHAAQIGFGQNFSILDQEDSRDLISLCVKDLKIDTTGKRFPRGNVLQSIYSYARNKGCTVEAAVEQQHPKFLPILREIEAVCDRYEAQKRAQNAMDFDDLLLKLLELLEFHPNVAEHLSRQFEYILVDEFQDTNAVQARIVRLLGNVHGNILVVGDDAQSIYSFRAADIQNILQFPSEYQQTKVHRLTRNYRSTPQILNLANNVIAHNEEQFPKKLTAERSGGDISELIPAGSAGQEAQYIAEQILALQSQGYPLSEMAVLFRATFHSQTLEFELMRRDIPYDYRGGLKFFERSHVKDIVAHIRLAHNLKDGMAWVRVLKIHPGIGLVSAGKIAAAAAEQRTLKDVLSMPVSGKRVQIGWDGARRVLKKMTEARPFASDYIRAIASSGDYKAYLENEFPNYQDRLEDLEQFAIFAEQFDDLAAFLEAVSLTDDFAAVTEERMPQDDEKIVLSTIHQAKGLEWDAVFIMHLADGMFPHKRSLDDEKQLEEERRLFYVAATRARKRLFLTYPATKGYEHIEICQPSMFLDEIPEDAIERVTLKRATPPRSPYGSGRSSFNSSYGGSGYEEPTIVLDDMGERVKKPMPGSFLRGLDDL